MISAVEVKNLRGIREGKLEGLTPLVVLVGPNGCGKSTLLDALLIGGSQSPAVAIGEVVSRHSTVGDATRWMFWKGIPSNFVEITIRDESDTRNYYLGVEDNGNDKHTIWCDIGDGIKLTDKVGTVFLNSIAVGHHRDHAVDFRSLNARLIETDAKSVPLTDLYSEIVERGRKKEVSALLSQVVLGYEDLVILTEGNKPYLSIVLNDHSIPNEITGEGIQALLRLSLELASRPGGIVLLEEPEVHQHPGALRQSAKAIWAAIRRGVQVVISTHSLEFIDTLLSEVQTQEELDQMSVFRLLLKEGCLSSSRIAGSDIAFSRTEIGDDLR